MRFSRRSDLITLWQAGFDFGYVGVYGAYKRKDQKVRPVDAPLPDGSAPCSGSWQAEIIKEETKRYVKDPEDKYADWLIPKFSGLAKGARLTPERLQRMRIGDELTEQEKDLFTEMLYNREAALAWTFAEMGRIRPEVTPPIKIRTVEHKAWQSPGFHIPRALTGIVSEMIRDRIKAEALEYCHGPYRNPWFLVKKKEKGKYRIVNAALEMNKVTIRDANLPPSVDEFSEEFAGCVMSSLIDFFSGYDQVPIDVTSRDMTAFMTPVGLVRQTSLPMGATNSVAEFVRVINRILEDLIPKIARQFVDDLGVKGSKTWYNFEEVLPGIRRAVMEHVQNLDKVLAAIERAEGTVSGEKSQFCFSGLKIVGYICDCEGRHPDTAKVIKILDWPPCQDLNGARGFLGICVYYRIWIEGFAVIAAPIYFLFRKGVVFHWGVDQQEAMDILKLKLTNPPALVSIDYESGDEIVLGVDASLEDWGSHLLQIRDKKRHPVRYESGIWSEAEKRYDATKRECRGVLKALKKVRYYLYDVHFTLEVDAQVLAAQLNRSGTDLPGALVTRWLAWIRLFDSMCGIYLGLSILRQMGCLVSRRRQGMSRKRKRRRTLTNGSKYRWVASTSGPFPLPALSSMIPIPNILRKSPLILLRYENLQR